MKTFDWRILFLTLMISLKLMGTTELMPEIQYPSIDEKLSQFIKTISNLQADNFLDGEILIVLENKMLLHEVSKDIACFKQPIFMIG